MHHATIDIATAEHVADRITIDHLAKQLVLVFAATMFMTACGCSCSRRPEWDSGLRDTEPAKQAQRGGADAGRTASSRQGSGTGDGSGQGAGDGGKEGGGTGEGAGGSGKDPGTGGKGSGDRGAAGEGTSGSPDGDSQAGGAPVAGNEAGTAAGTGNDSSQAPAALPGRPRPKPRYDAATSVEVAERHLRQAATDRTAGDLGAAYGKAVEAFEAVEPHAAIDDACKQTLARAKRMCTELAESQNRENRPQPVPTLFE
jgi:hypothetical protein